ncbi:hypothetical protein B6A14_08350 [Polynucleobacter hirudinilacicola]|uniref:Uncharacterized protein n=1 Tax=Polynucleobacter hirudinilacicola TaxID=1743166 RepID=A0A210RXW5_9BURK|nr:hypothetical protein [Polynucleobacter hirudinilacicola]OWF65767.1 hypothetical protein B6A14_08350 [Polynucleobacter hirudinilacicola]
MNIVKCCTLLFLSGTQLLMGCSTSKLEARLEANPQCKDVYNAKTGALMPCPGTDRSFYVAAGLEAPRQAKSAPVVSITTDSSSTSTSAVVATTSTGATRSQSSPAMRPDCKPTIHQKTGGTMPCPPQD